MGPVVFRAAFCALALSSLAAADVRVWQDTLPLPTYLEGEPDPNPPFDIFATTRFNYPYTLRDNLTDKRQVISWRAVFLENEYLKCSVLPDIGGHLYTCLDKISGQPMFYANPSIKKAQIGYRGAWAAFGIEFNFPVSHNWVSMSPVDFSFHKNDDGSASILVGNIDRPYGVQWTVELKLRPASTVLEERVTLSNPSDVRHRFYWWNNAAVRVWDDSRICYPMRWAASHGFTEVRNWPVDDSGADLSVITNQRHGPVSMFVHGSREPFMGVYHPHTQTGVAHYADYAELPGKKIWSWGVDADGLDWRRALSDDNSAYVEVQAGPMRNQETYAFLQPRQSIQFSEYWMPVRAIGGIARANLNGVLNLRRESGKLIAGYNANQAVRGAKARILDGSKPLFEATVDLAPERPWSHQIAASQRPLTVEFLDSDGHTLIRQIEGKYDWSPESEIHVGPQPRSSPSSPLEIGTDQELNGRLLAAYDTYTRALENTPDDFYLRVAAGRLAAALLRYADAARWLEPAQARATYDPEVAYYLGLAYLGLGRPRAAREQLEAAHRMPEFRAAAGLKLAELSAREGGVRPPGSEADALVREEAAELRRRDPQSDPERVLAIAAGYMRLGLWRDALAVLSKSYPDVPAEQKEPGLPLPQSHPIVAYYRAFCREKLGDAAAADYAAASRLPTAYVFPNGAQTLEVVEAALRVNSGDATAHFFLGSLRLTSGLVDNAIAEWNTARKLNPSIPVLHASLGRTLLHVKRDVPAALEVFREGLAADPANTQLYAGLSQSLAYLQHSPEERAAALARFPDSSRLPSALAYDLALSYAEAGEFQKARSVFQNRFFAREEGGTNVRQVWIRVRAMEAEWNAAHEACETALSIVDHIAEPVPGLDFTRDGLDRFINEAPNQAAFGLAESRCGRADAARQRLGRLSQSSDPASVAFAWRLARSLPGAAPEDWAARLQNASARAESNAANSSWSAAIAGIVQSELGHADAARDRLRAALLMSDRNLAHHFSRQALR